MTIEELREELWAAVQGDAFLDRQDVPGQVIDAVAGPVKERAIDQVEALGPEVNPLTARANLPDWEVVFGVAQSEIALFGKPGERTNQILARWREAGPPTVDNIRAVLQAYVQYEDLTEILISETPRAELRTLHTRTWAGLAGFGPGAATITWEVRDDAKVSPAGPQVDLAMTLPELGQLVATLTGPSGTTHTITGPGRGAMSGLIGDRIRLYFRAAAGGTIFGTWTLTLNLTAGAGSCTAAELFVEGFGRDAKGYDGLGAAKFHWAPILEITKIGRGQAQYDADLLGRSLRGAHAAVQRLSYARSWRGTVVWPIGLLAPPPPLDVDAIPDDPSTVPDACIPG